jgi:acyl transferase domain-containing protein
LDAVGEAPTDRRAPSDRDDSTASTNGHPGHRRGGFVGGVDLFDADFFGISPREAACIDPQQRLLMEVAWEALEDAGQAPERLAGEPVGVFVGISTDDYSRLHRRSVGAGDVYDLTGNAASVAANRLSYQFDFRGPSLAVDTACSSSLVAVQLACQALHAGEASLALAGGVNLILSPEVSASFAGRASSPPTAAARPSTRGPTAMSGARGRPGRLKRLSAARADGDPIYAVIRGGAVNQDGRTNGLTAPSPGRRRPSCGRPTGGPAWRRGGCSTSRPTARGRSSATRSRPRPWGRARRGPGRGSPALVGRRRPTSATWRRRPGPRA